MDENTLIFMAFSIFAIMLALMNFGAYGGIGIIVVFVAIIGIVLIFIINYADFLIFPLFTKLLNIKVLLAKGYYVPKGGEAVIKVVNGIYYATGYLTANIFNYVFTAEHLNAEEEAKLAESPNVWERILMNISFPFKFNIISSAEEVQKFRDELEGKRGVLEYHLSKEMESQTPSQMVVDELQSKINTLQTRIDRLSAGERPINEVMYIETTSFGVSEKEALDKLSNQLEHLQTVFGSFDISINRVIGRELHMLFGMNYTLQPESEMSEMFATQK